MEDSFFRPIKVFKLRYIEKLTHREVGEKLGRIDGTGSIGREHARGLSNKGARALAHWSRKDHELHNMAYKMLWGHRRGGESADEWAARLARGG